MLKESYLWCSDIYVFKDDNIDDAIVLVKLWPSCK